MKNLKYLLAIAQNYSFGPKRLMPVVLYKDWERLWNDPKADYQKEIDEKIVQLIRESRKQFDPDKIISQYEKLGIQIIVFGQPDYPKLLAEIADPPAIIYTTSKLDGLKNQNLSVVGSRRISSYGRGVGNKLLPKVIQSGINIISGLALGCDSLAHEITLDHNGITYAVVGTGLDMVYPRQNTPLAKRICERGALISEFPLGVGPARYHFPMRNRIIAGLSQATLVLEAAEKSGSLITARLALDYNREVLTVPANIGHTNSVGTNNLIKLGAVPVTNSEDILQIYN